METETTLRCKPTKNEIKHHFSAREWKLMPEYEKLRNLNSLRNYLILQKLGLDTEKPEFLNNLPRVINVKPKKIKSNNFEIQHVKDKFGKNDVKCDIRQNISQNYKDETVEKLTSNLNKFDANKTEDNAEISIKKTFSYVNNKPSNKEMFANNINSAKCIEDRHLLFNLRKNSDDEGDENSDDIYKQMITHRIYYCIDKNDTRSTNNHTDYKNNNYNIIPNINYEKAKFLMMEGYFQKCTQCDSRFIYEANCLSHTKGTYQCTHCKSIFKNKLKLKNHLKIYTGEHPYYCQHCKARFLQKRPLNAQLKIHMEEHPYQCEHCKTRFTSKRFLRDHIKIYAGERPYHCEHCNARFTVNGNLKKHLRIHTGERPYQCEHCKARFTQKGNLIKHRRIHTGERPYQCEHCKARFTQKGHLKDHLRIHTGERPYQCEHCKARFTQKRSLKDHLRIHTGERPYQCEHCKARFTQKGSLKTHLRIHTGERPYQCEHCKARFTQKGNLKNHVKIHTSVKIVSPDLL